MNKTVATLLTGTLVVLSIPGLAQAPADPRPGTNPPAETHHRRGQHRRNRFKQMDQDNDGKISRSEWKGKDRAFDRLDANHDGFLTREELKAGREQHQGRRQPPANQ